MLEKVKKKTQTPIEMLPYSAERKISAGRLRVRVEGRTALLTHNPQSMGTAPEAGRGTRVPDAAVEAEAGTYRLEDGSFAIKGEAFRASLLGAAGAWKAKRSTMKSRLAHVTVIEELVQLLDPETSKPLTSYVIDARRAIVQRQGIIRRRPRFDRWACEFTVEYDPALVTDPKMVIDIVADAGGRVGVGDYRPAKNGWFGRYTVASYCLLD